MKKQERKKENGITLVALVVTIIVLIILAGITLNIVLDNDGIINKVQEATEEYENAEKEEQEILGQVENYLNPPIPDGYVASSVLGENIVATGLVIYEGEEPVTKENHEEAMRERNQYVWIPVDDINSMVMCISNIGESVCNLVLEEDILKCTTHPETETELVGRLYIAQYSSSIEDDNTIGLYKINFSSRNQTYNDNNREPSLTNSDTDNNLEIEQLKSDFITMATNVAKNGGFYISRYEVGKNGESKKGQKVLTANDTDGSNYLGANTWYGLYNTLKENNKQMIWGCQYDQVIKFIGDEAQIGHTYIETNKILSGENESDKMKNIYDLEGNFWEWIMEENTTVNRTSRGGFSDRAREKIFYPASYRGRNAYNPTYTDMNASTRSTLY